jgi:hypothetical protein
MISFSTVAVVLAVVPCGVLIFGSGAARRAGRIPELKSASQRIAGSQAIRISRDRFHQPPACSMRLSLTLIPSRTNDSRETLHNFLHNPDSGGWLRGIIRNFSEAE